MIKQNRHIFPLPRATYSQVVDLKKVASRARKMQLLLRLQLGGHCGCLQGRQGSSINDFWSLCIEFVRCKTLAHKGPTWGSIDFLGLFITIDLGIPCIIVFVIMLHGSWSFWVHISGIMMWAFRRHHKTLTSNHQQVEVKGNLDPLRGGY